MKQVNLAYSYIEGSDNPLSSDAGIIKGNKYTWIFDVGANEKMADEINNIDGPKAIVISHFHQDHISNLDKIKYDELYVGDNTFKYTNRGIVIDKDIVIDGMHLFKIPSCHAKGSIGLMVSDYAFIGDSLSPCMKNNEYVYNAQLLKEEIDLFNSLNVKYFVGSHHMNEVDTKDNVINYLESIYQNREKNNPYIKKSKH